MGFEVIGVWKKYAMLGSFVFNRTIYNNMQLEALEQAFKVHKYPDAFAREELAKKANLQEDRIQVRLITMPVEFLVSAWGNF